MIAIALHSRPARRPIPDDLTGRARKRARERRRTKERYPANWPRVSLLIRRLSGGYCERCGVYRGIKHLTCHHVGASLATGEGWRPGNPHESTISGARIWRRFARIVTRSPISHRRSRSIERSTLAPD